MLKKGVLLPFLKGEFMNNCLFCKIVNKEIPNYTLYEDEVCLAFLDISQATYGHALVICKEHYSNLLEVPSKVLEHMMSVAQKIAIAESKLPNVKGFNILNNCNEVAGQTIHHFHIHIIPRYEEDDLTLKFKENPLSNEAFLELAQKIKEKY